jgi:hypothetical protein
VFYLRNTRSTGAADIVVNFGDPTQPETPMLCDWDGDGVATPGVVRGTQWFITNSLTPGVAEFTFEFGDIGDIPVCADWDRNRTQTPGVVRATQPGLTVFAKQSVAGGNADINSDVNVCYFDGPMQVLPGGAFSDGTPWIGCHQQDFFAFPPDRPGPTGMQPPGPQWEFGIPGDVAVGLPTPWKGAAPLGVFRPTTAEWFVMSNSNFSVTEDSFVYGNPGDTALSWIGH